MQQTKLTTFDSDLELGRQKEKQFIEVLKAQGYTTTSTITQGEFNGYDVKAIKDNIVTTYEVKFDIKSNLTGNVAIEAYKVINGLKQPSGITATKATYQVYTFPKDDSFYVIATSNLGTLLKEKKYDIVVNGGDRNTCKLALFNKEFFTSNCTKIN